MAASSSTIAKKSPLTWGNFLESVAPGTAHFVSELCEYGEAVAGGPYDWTILTPILNLYCDSESCDKVLRFQFDRNLSSNLFLPGKTSQNVFLIFRCRNCQKQKHFALIIKRDGDAGSGTVYKFGELPHFGPPVPARVITLIGPNRELFLQGRRAESQGLGIGAFSYYRRVVENQWGRIVAEITKVAERTGADGNVISMLREIAKEHQFKKAVKEFNPAIPPELMIGGQNPLILLHGALSEGLHEDTDAECLSLAHDIRVVLTKLAERMDDILKNEAELNEAVERLHRKKGLPTTGQSA
jgi:hypothetical protein